MNGFGPTSLGVWIHSFLCFSRHVALAAPGVSLATGRGGAKGSLPVWRPKLPSGLTGNPTFGRQLAGYKQALRDQMGCSQEDSDPARRTVSSRRGKLLVCSGVFLSHQTSSTAPALWVVAVGRSLVEVSAHSYRLLVTWTLSRDGWP